MGSASFDHFTFETCADCTDPADCEFYVRIAGAQPVIQGVEAADRVAQGHWDIDRAASFVSNITADQDARYGRWQKTFESQHPECNFTDEIILGLFQQATNHYRINGTPDIEQII